MKVHIYKGEAGELSVLVIASTGKARAPILVNDVTEENVVGKVLPAVKLQRGPRQLRPLPVPGGTALNGPYTL